MGDCDALRKCFPTNGWRPLAAEFDNAYMQRLCRFLHAEYKDWGGYPCCDDVFKAFALTSLSTVRVVILGHDPYPDPSQATGLAFSVPYSRTQRALPFSLKRIYTAIERDLGRESSTDGDLTAWAKEEHILLLNTVLTRSEAGPHAQRGWECFIDKAIELLNAHRDSLVFLLWGKEARKREALITNPTHLVRCAVHPSARDGKFLGFKRGGGPFSAANTHLGSSISW